MILDRQELEEMLATLKAKKKPEELLDLIELEDNIRDIEVLLGIKENSCGLDDDDCLSCGS